MSHSDVADFHALQQYFPCEFRRFTETLPKKYGGGARDVGALAQWQRELRAGFRTVDTRDAIYRAAALEARARDGERCGQYVGARYDRLEAARILVADHERRCR